MPSQETEFEFSPSGVMRDEEFERAENKSAIVAAAVVE